MSNDEHWYYRLQQRRKQRQADQGTHGYTKGELEDLYYEGRARIVWDGTGRVRYEPIKKRWSI